MSNVAFKPIPTKRLSFGADLVHPDEPRPVTIDTPALEVMTDFHNIEVVTIPPDASLIVANETMSARHVRLLLVVNAAEQLLGLITARDTLGERPLQLLAQRGGAFNDLIVSDLMRGVDVMDVVDLRDAMHASVGDVVATLKALGRQHLLVGSLEVGNLHYRVRGLFSATQIGRQLGVTVQTFEVAGTFAEIEAALVRS